jgi:hypothetical protein
MYEQNPKKHTRNQPFVEKPIYVLPQVKTRALVPKVITLLVLGGIFYLGVLLNLSLLDITKDTTSIVNLVSLIILLCVVALGIFLSFHKAEMSYKFYRGGLSQGKKSINYISIINTTPKQGILDKIFKTYAINLGSGFYLRNISQSIQISGYLQKLINYSKQNQTNSYQSNSR